MAGTRTPTIDAPRLLGRLRELGDTGRGADGALSRVAASDADKAARDLLVRWLEEADLDVTVDGIGNIFGTWRPAGCADVAPVMVGSHVDTVIDGGIYDGAYGVLAGLAVVEALQAAGVEAPSSIQRPVVVAAFTNEEGVRYAPDMMGSLAHVGGLDLDEALRIVGTDGSRLGDELERIGYAGSMPLGAIQPRAFLEIHIEQGPILEREGIRIGAVENLQGISWQRITLGGVANHAGTTPTALRHDAGLAAAKVITFLRELVDASGGSTVATVGTLSFEPNAINVIPSQAIFTVDLRDPDNTRLTAAEETLRTFLDGLPESDGVTVSVERLVRFDPVLFDQGLVEAIERSAHERGHSCRRMTSGAGHDAQMMARICPSAMVFVPSKDGISHNPREFTADDDLVAGAEVLLGTVWGLTRGD